MDQSNENAGQRVRTRRNLRMARDAALTGAGVAGIAGAAVLTKRGAKAIAALSKRGRVAIRSGLKSAKGATDTAKDVLEKNVRPAVDQIKHAGGNTVDATRIYADAGRVYGRAKENVKRHIPGAYREGVAEGMANPRKDSMASKAGRLAKKLGFSARPYRKGAMQELMAILNQPLTAFSGDARQDRVKNALLYGTGGAYLGGLLAGGKPMRVPVPSKLVRKLGGKAGKGAWKKVSVNAARAGAGAGIAAGLALDPRKRKKNGVGSVIAEHAPGLVTATQSFAARCAAEGGKLKMESRKKKFKSRKMVVDSVTRTTSFARGEAGGWAAEHAELPDGNAAYMGYKRRGVGAHLRRNAGTYGGAVAGGAIFRHPKGALAGAVLGKAVDNIRSITGLRKAFKRAGSKTPLDDAMVVHSIGAPREEKKAKKFSQMGQIHEFGGDDQPVERGTGRKVSHIGAFMNPDKAGRLKRDASGKTVKDDDGNVVYDDVGAIPGAALIAAAHAKAAPVVKWGGRAKSLAKDAAGALRGEVKRDKAGRVQKREWEKPWAQREGKKALVGAGLLAYAAGVHHNVKIPVPNTILRKVNAKVAKRGSEEATKILGVKATKIGMRGIHNGAIAAVHDKINEGAKRLTGAQFFPDRHLAAALDDLMNRFEAMRMRQVSRLSNGSAHDFAYGDAYDAGWDVRDPRGRSARVFAPGAGKRERRPKKWHEKIENERKLWGAGVVAAGLAGAGVTRKLLKGGAHAISMPSVGSFTTSTGAASRRMRTATSSLR